MSTAKNGVLVREPNILNVTCGDIEINPVVHFRGGYNVAIGLRLKISSYDVEQVLCCLLEEYGEELILKKIKEL